jgi:hypothetical protein
MYVCIDTYTRTQCLGCLLCVCVCVCVCYTTCTCVHLLICRSHVEMTLLEGSTHVHANACMYVYTQHTYTTCTCVHLLICWSRAEMTLWREAMLAALSSSIWRICGYGNCMYVCMYVRMYVCTCWFMSGRNKIWMYKNKLETNTIQIWKKQNLVHLVQAFGEMVEM